MVDPDTLIEHERLRALLREGTGKGVTVAILDTGVDAEHPALQGAVRSSYEVVRRGRRLVCQPSTAGDQVSHGTACAGIIHKIAPEAELISVRVIGTNAVGTGDQLLHGLAWAIEQDVDVINLSLGTLQQRFNAALHELVDRAYFTGKILVAAANNHRLPSYPAHFASLIAVDNQSFPDPLTFRYQLGQPIETVAHGIYVNAPSPGGKYQCFTGTSFACPHITGLVARLRSVISSLTSFQLKTFLWSLRENRDDATSE
ncbi:MAG: S8 family serine peptidase [Planctomycetes bacterium]|nr:S8 family serine peptidase [Planctomycetota bacterium]